MSQNLAIQRLGIFGGSFDPPHQAHITLAARAIEQLHLDQLLVIPTGDAWHKTRNLTLAPHRLAMTRLAFADLPKVSVDSREIDRHDQAQAFSTWHRWKDILKRTTVVVAFRPEDKSSAESVNHAQWHNGLPTGAIRLEMPSLAISATDIRFQLAQSDTFPSALPKGVCEYIQQHSLYKNDR